MDDLEQIAQDIVAGKIVTHRHIPQDLLPEVFIVLRLYNKNALDELRYNQIDTIFARLTEALPNTIRGYPTFLSMELLDKHDAKIVWDRCVELGGEYYKRQIGETV